MSRTKISENPYGGSPPASFWIRRNHISQPYPSPTSLSASSTCSSTNQQATSSSESTISSSQFTTASSSNITDEESTIIHQRTTELVPRSHIMVNSNNLELHTSSSSLNSGNNKQPAKSSPFGLNGHYLTMPDTEIQVSGSSRRDRTFIRHKNYKPSNHENETNVESDDDNETDRNSNQDQIEAAKRVADTIRSKNYMRANWKKKSRVSLQSTTTESCNTNDDLAIGQPAPELTPSSGHSSFTPPTSSWLLDYANGSGKQAQNMSEPPNNLIHSSQPKSIHNNHHFHNRYHPHHLDYLPPDEAGMDAKKCNAKEKGCYDDEYQHQPAKMMHHVNKGNAPPDMGGGGEGVGGPGLNSASDNGESSGLLIRFSSIMYATFLVILGCILHVSELRQKSKNSSDHIYTTIVALIGIFWLMFLQADLQRYKRYASKYILIETIFNDHRQKQQQQRRADDLLAGIDPSARSTTSSSASLVNDRMSMNTEVIFKKTAYKMYQRRAALDHHSQMNNSKRHLHHHHLNQYPGPKLGPSSKSSSYTSANHHNHHDLYRSAATDHQIDDRADHLVPAYKFLHGKMGANFYLKCGMAAFCFGHVIHEGLRFGQQVYFFGDGNVHCRDSAALVAHLVMPLYSFYQLFMMFKYSNLVINRHKVLARFGLMHIIGTSVTFWFRTILEEAFEDFVHKMDYFKTNKPQYNLSFMTMIGNETLHHPAAFASPLRAEASEGKSDWTFSKSLSTISNQTDPMTQSLLSLMSSPMSATITPQLVKHLPESYACAQNTLLTTKSMNALPYLYPFTIEYNLLLAATFLSLYFNIGKIGHAGMGHKSDSSVECRPIYNKGEYQSSNIQKPISMLSSGSNSQIDAGDNSSGNRMILQEQIGNYQDGEYRHHYRDKELGEYKSNFVVNADCHSANKGLFCGFFVLLVTLVTIVIFFVTINKPTHIQLGIKINLIQEATLTALILIVTLAGFKQVVKLNRNPYLKDKVTTDDVLMLIPLPFFFIHSLLSFRAETAAVSGALTGFSSILLQTGHHQQVQDSLISSNGNLQSFMLSKNNNDNDDNNNKTDIESRTKLNIPFVGKLNGTNSRIDDDLVTKTNASINNNSTNNNGDSNSSNIKVVGRGSQNGNSSQIDHFKLITVALNIIVMIEVLVQTNFIIDGMRRCSESRYLRFKKPGRELITFAIILNITYWIVATFETKSVEQYKTEIEYYGPLPYMFISHTTLPVMLFYRYHSSVCLAEIWNRAYKPPKKR